MTHISIQNALQNHYLSPEDRYISQAKGSGDETTIQNIDSSLHPIEDRNLAQSVYPVIQHTEERTIIQYADSAVYRPADQTTAQLPVLISHPPEDQTIYQQNTQPIQQEEVPIAKPKNSIQGQTSLHNSLRMKGSFSARFAQLSEQLLASIRRVANFKKRGSSPTRQSMAVGTSKILTSSVQDNCILPDEIVAEVQPSQEDYQKVLWELDHCRLSFARELARNGKLRDAIALANKIPETSRFFRDSQTLIRSWKQL